MSSSLVHVVRLTGVQGLLQLFLKVSSAGGSTPDGSGKPSSTDPAFKRMLMYLLVGTKGGPNRLQIIDLIKDEPMNANKIGERLKLDYKTIQHHLKVLQENNVVVTSASGSYGAMYFLTPFMERNLTLVDEIRGRFGKR